MPNNAALNTEQKYMIVPRAKDGMWETYYGRDPKIHAMPLLASAFYKLSGAAAKLKLQYDSIDAAQADLTRLFNIDPSGGYGICQIDFFSSDKPYLHYERKILSPAHC